MPPAKKTPTKKRASRTKRSRSGALKPAPDSGAARREVERSIARFEKRLDDANEALQVLGKHLGREAQRSYKEVTAALKTLRREAARTNRTLLRDFDKLRVGPTQSKPSTRSSRGSGPASSPSGTGATRARASYGLKSSRSASSRSTRSGSKPTASVTSRPIRQHAGVRAERVGLEPVAKAVFAEDRPSEAQLIAAVSLHRTFPTVPPERLRTAAEMLVEAMSHPDDESAPKRLDLAASKIADVFAAK
jgi:hypothetical protein